MNRFIRTLLGFCITFVSFNSYFLAEGSTGNLWTPAENGEAGIPAVRRTRDVDRPTPVNCRLRSWTPWTACNSCTDLKFRFRYMEQPSQFGGERCLDGTLWGTLACPRATTQCLEADRCGERFTCVETGRCISQSLRCNGEKDCGDASDEDGCERTAPRNKCSILPPIPGVARGTQGFNVLTGEFVGQVLDSKYYGGQCEYVYNGEWRRFAYDSFCEHLHYNEDDKNYRKPYNYHTYRFVAQATSQGSSEYYTDVVKLLEARNTEKSFNFGLTVEVADVEAGGSLTYEKKDLTNITKHNSQELGFVRVLSEVQTAQFKMRSDKLMLDDDMYVSLMDLPERYDFGMYSHFLKTFGTHYVTEGTMGGTVEEIAVVNKTSMTRTSRSAEEIGVCLGASFGVVGVTGIALICGKNGEIFTENRNSWSEVEDIFTVVKGGAAGASIGVKANPNPETYRRWGATLQYNPVLIKYETMPIYELVRLSTAADHVGERLAHLRRAWDEYQLQFSPCRCAPCRHNGRPLLAGTSCRCLCRNGYRGDACQETERPDRKTDGSWSCWGAWASCRSGRASRTRTCDNPPRTAGEPPAWEPTLRPSAVEVTSARRVTRGRLLWSVDRGSASLPAAH